MKSFILGFQKNIKDFQTWVPNKKGKEKYKKSFKHGCQIKKKNIKKSYLFPNKNENIKKFHTWVPNKKEKI